MINFHVRLRFAYLELLNFLIKLFSAIIFNFMMKRFVEIVVEHDISFEVSFEVLLLSRSQGLNFVLALVQLRLVENLVREAKELGKQY